MRDSRTLHSILQVMLPVAAMVALPACAVQTAPDEEVGSTEEALRAPQYSIDDAFATPGPMAIGHRGSGVNLGEDTTKPIENTIPAFRSAFLDGARMVELDVQLTADGEVIVYHDDFLPNYVCINTLTRRQLAQQAPQIPSLQAVLVQARLWNLIHRGLLMVELKPPSPMCDPADTGDVALTAAAVNLITKNKMTDQVILTSFSPTMLATAAALAPDMDRALDLTALQLLPADVVEQLSGMPVTEIDKPNGLGLRWAEVGPLYRLPGYDAIDQYLGTGYYLGSYAMLMDRLVPLQAPDQAAALVQAIHGLGMKSVMWTINDEPEWQFFASIGVDAIVTDDVPMGVSLEPPRSCH